MGNRKIQAYYEALARRIQSPEATRNKAPDSTDHDVAYVKRFADSKSSLLELGAGTGLLLNRIAGDFRRVMAVELRPEFSRFIVRSEHVHIVNADLVEFETNEVFDLVLAFGVMNYFNADEAAALYLKIVRWLRPGGKLIVKNQMGREQDVIVDGMSAELQSNYYSEYRTPANERELIESAGLNIEQQDSIYPDHFNRWPNTHFVALVAAKPQ